MAAPKKPGRGGRPLAPTSWDALAAWYDGWVGAEGSAHHRAVAVPAVLALLDPQPGEAILDVGAGQGVLAPHIAAAGARYTGVDASPRLIALARRRHGAAGRFLPGDARALAAVPGLAAETFDGVVFLLSIQDMDPLDAVLASAAWALAPGGRIVLLLGHPAFRVPRQSGWGWDAGRQLQYRRVDRYLTPLAVPLKALPAAAGGGATRSFHRPLAAYVNGLAAAGLLVDRLDEIPGPPVPPAGPLPAAADRARQEIPLFLGLRARKPPDAPR